MTGSGMSGAAAGGLGGVRRAHVVYNVALREQQHIVKVLKELRRRLQQADERREAEAMRVVG